MPNVKERKKREEREERRGLFTLGLMAILITWRISQTKIVLGNLEFTSVIDFVLALWGMYAFLMIVSFSTDLLPERVCDVAYGVGLLFLAFSFVFFFVLVVAIAASLPKYWNLAALLVIVIPGWYFIIHEIYRGYKRLKSRRARTPLQTHL